jgi:hypothetical protein
VRAQSASDERARTAYHEAGHAVVAHAQGLEVHGLSIRPGEGTLGRSSDGGDRGSVVRRSDGVLEEHISIERAEANIVTCFAGFEAERRFDPAADPSGSCDDQDTARYWIGMLGDPGHEPRLRAQSAALVGNHWRSIERIARALLEFEDLDEWSNDLLETATESDAAFEHVLERMRAWRA